MKNLFITFIVIFIVLNCRSNNDNSGNASTVGNPGSDVNNNNEENINNGNDSNSVNTNNDSDRINTTNNNNRINTPPPPINTNNGGGSINNNDSDRVTNNGSNIVNTNGDGENNDNGDEENNDNGGGANNSNGGINASTTPNNGGGINNNQNPKANINNTNNNNSSSANTQNPLNLNPNNIQTPQNDNRDINNNQQNDPEIKKWLSDLFIYAESQNEQLEKVLDFWRRHKTSSRDDQKKALPGLIEKFKEKNIKLEPKRAYELLKNAIQDYNQSPEFYKEFILTLLDFTDEKGLNFAPSYLLGQKLLLDTIDDKYKNSIPDDFKNELKTKMKAKGAMTKDELEASKKEKAKKEFKELKQKLNDALPKIKSSKEYKNFENYKKLFNFIFERERSRAWDQIAEVKKVDKTKYFLEQISKPRINFPKNNDNKKYAILSWKAGYIPTNKFYYPAILDIIENEIMALDLIQQEESKIKKLKQQITFFRAFLNENKNTEPVDIDRLITLIENISKKDDSYVPNKALLDSLNIVLKNIDQNDFHETETNMREAENELK